MAQFDKCEIAQGPQLFIFDATGSHNQQSILVLKNLMSVFHTTKQCALQLIAFIDNQIRAHILHNYLQF